MASGDPAYRRRFVRIEDKRVARAYYNEIDPFAADWLEEAAAAGAIPPGDVDRRSIEDVCPSDLDGYTQLHFFAGIGTWAYALRQAGWPDDRPVWTASCPCQPFSQAGARGGLDDERHLWPALHWLARQQQPDIIFGEQVSSADGLAWLDIVSSDLEAEGYAVAAIDTCAAGVGAPHIRQRLYWLADASGRQQWRSRERVEGREGAARGRSADHPWQDVEWIECSDGRRRPAKPGLHPLAARSPGHLERLRGYGNGLCAPVAVEFIGAYLDCEAT